MDLILRDRLKERNWSYKYNLYNRYFDYVEISKNRKNVEISVIIISWRLHENTLLNLKSLSAQRKKSEFEVIFVNNGCDDEEFKDLLPYIDCYIRLNANTGAYLARNIGAIFSSASIVLFLEDDGIPNSYLIESHIMVHTIFDVLSVRGVYLPERDGYIPKNYKHYYQGIHFSPSPAVLEGNASFQSKEFFMVGGWDDNIKYGHGGLELSMKLSSIEPNKTKQIYSPISIIYHDPITDPLKQEEKEKKQNKSKKRLMELYPEWDAYLDSWNELYERHDLIRYKEKIDKQFPRFFKLYQKVIGEHLSIFARNTSELDKRNKTMLFRLKYLQEIRYIKIFIFGAGSLGLDLLHFLNNQQVVVSGFYDNDESKWGNYINGLAISNPNNIQDNDYIIIASTWEQEIVKQLLERGLKPIENFVVYEI